MPRTATTRRRRSAAENPVVPALFKPPAELGELRNIYRRADGTLRHGATWRDRGTAERAREILPGETFVELRDMQNAADMALAGVSGAQEG